MAAGGLAVVATFTSGATSLVLSSPYCKFVRQRPGVQSKDEIRHPITMQAFYNTTPGEELAVTLDSTP
jgi:hypothetical protein